MEANTERGGENMFWDSTYILVIIGALICAIASINVNATYRKYSR